MALETHTRLPQKLADAKGWRSKSERGHGCEVTLNHQAAQRGAWSGGGTRAGVQLCTLRRTKVPTPHTGTDGSVRSTHVAVSLLA
jgi:hypothetical protein